MEEHKGEPGRRALLQRSIQSAGEPGHKHYHDHHNNHHALTVCLALGRGFYKYSSNPLKVAVGICTLQRREARPGSEKRARSKAKMAAVLSRSKEGETQPQTGVDNQE